MGELDGRTTPRIEEIHRLLSHVAECHLLTDIKARVWVKRCFGSQTVASALVNAPYHVVLSDERALRVVGPLVGEALEVAHAYGMHIPDGPFFQPALYFPKTPADTQRLLEFIRATVARQARHVMDDEKAGTQKYVKQGSGIHWDVIYRKCKSEVRWNHGPREEKADAVGVPVPLNTKLHRMIYEIEDHRRGFGWQNFAEFDELIRSLGKQLP